MARSMTQDEKYTGASHPVDEVLLAHLDGEMRPTERAALDKHLAGCWACRGRVQELSAQIKTFMQAREAILPPREVLDYTPVEQLRARLHRHAAQQEQESSFAGRFWLAVRRSAAQVAAGVGAHRRAALAVVTSIVIVAVTLLDVFTTPLAAETVLLRSQAYEAKHVPPAGRVRLSSVRLEKISLAAQTGAMLGTIQVARDSESQEVALGTDLSAGKQHVTSPLDPAGATDSLLHQIPATAALPGSVLAYLGEERWLPEVSALEFRKLVQGRQSDATSSKKVNDELEIHYPFATGHVSGITEAILRVDRETYAPREMSVRTAESTGNWEYRFTGQQESLPERTTEWANIFSSPSLPIESTTSRRSSPIPQLISASPLSYAQTTASAQEVQLSETLHDLDTCLGEEVYVLPMSDGSLLVQGIVEQATKRDAIRAALQKMPFPVGIRLYVPSELSKSPSLFNSPFTTGRGTASSLSAPVTLADFSNQQTVIYGQLSKHFVEQGLSAEDADRKVAEVSNEIVTLSRQTLLHAWALRRLNEEFDSRRTAGLPADTLQRIERLRADHRRWISSLARRQSEMLAGLGESGIPQAGDSKQIGDPELIELAAQLNSAVRALFAVSGSSSGADSGLQQLVAVLHRLER